MCKRTTCRLCGRPASTACGDGDHLEEVLADVAHADRCHCGEHAAASLARDEAHPPHAEGPGHVRAPNWSRAIPDRHFQVGIRHGQNHSRPHKPDHRGS